MPKARKRYVGLDVHKNVGEYCILDTEGKKLDGGNFICEQSVLVNFAKKVLSPNDQVALKATTSTWTVVDILEPFVEKIVVGNEGLPPALTFDRLSSGEQRVLKEMGMTEKVLASEKVGYITHPKKTTPQAGQSRK
jgi:hypothetical protein